MKYFYLPILGRGERKKTKVEGWAEEESNITQCKVYEYLMKTEQSCQTGNEKVVWGGRQSWYFVSQSCLCKKARNPEY